MKRPYNFSAGPAALPQEVLEQAATEMLDWQGSGMSVMEMSHRGDEFMSIHHRAMTDLRELLDVPDHFRILFMQGGGLAENAIVPMNLCSRLGSSGVIDFVTTGSWSQKSSKEASKYASVNIAATSANKNFTFVPESKNWELSSNCIYLHICTNETIDGVEFQQLPDLKALGCEAPLIIDFSSHVGSRAVDWSKVGLAFAGAQKNLGPAGLTVVIVREDLLGFSLPQCPTAFNYQTVAANNSMFNTPPTFAIYMAGLVFQWLKREGGISEMENRSITKSTLLYQAIDESSLYVNKVDNHSRSRVNVPFYLTNESLNEVFITGAKEHGLLQIKGHTSVGGMRASIYNAMPLEGVQALVDFMQNFEKTKA